MMGWEAIEDDKNKKVLEVNGDEVQEEGMEECAKKEDVCADGKWD